MGLIGNLIYWPISSKDKVEKYQEIIRDEEWEAIEQYIPVASKFLDVGCGAGYSLMKAKNNRKCEVVGIDPEPGAHGVGRYNGLKTENTEILQGFSENLPFEDEQFDVVYSSHVLEHVNDEQKSLEEMKRVLKQDGTLIIGMPTAAMAGINLFSQVFFLTHIRIYRFLKSIITLKFNYPIKNIFILGSHSKPRAKYIWYDLKHYKISNWEKIVGGVFNIGKIITPCFYPYPDFVQFFKMKRNFKYSSSVFFICKLKKGNAF
ncbi:MAG: class I SAM-dependent methyltransferase [Bacteroidetes bacterium]|nr:class I SAM-dependent methyltransferase [Bacteroidota bacterium]MCB9225868.1 class I SAM-dependent methyltransferase [Chitinophagales bacterium]